MYGDVNLDIVQKGEHHEPVPSFFDWVISRTDNKTVEIITRDDYIDVGIETLLLQVK